MVQCSGPKLSISSFPVLFILWAPVMETSSFVQSYCYSFANQLRPVHHRVIPFLGWYQWCKTGISLAAYTWWSITKRVSYSHQVTALLKLTFLLRDMACCLEMLPALDLNS